MDTSLSTVRLGRHLGLVTWRLVSVTRDVFRKCLVSISSCNVFLHTLHDAVQIKLKLTSLAAETKRFVNTIYNDSGHVHAFVGRSLTAFRLYTAFLSMWILFYIFFCHLQANRHFFHCIIMIRRPLINYRKTPAYRQARWAGLRTFWSITASME